MDYVVKTFLCFTLIIETCWYLSRITNGLQLRLRRRNSESNKGDRREKNQLEYLTFGTIPNRQLLLTFLRGQSTRKKNIKIII